MSIKKLSIKKIKGVKGGTIGCTGTYMGDTYFINGKKYTCS